MRSFYLSKIIGMESRPPLEPSELYFKSVYERLWKPLYQKAFSVIKDENGAKDIVQEVFMSWWRRKNDTEILHIDAYLHGAVKICILKYIKANHKKIQVDFFEEAESFFASQSIGLKNSFADDLYAEKELQASLNNHVTGMPEKCQQIFRLRREEGLSIAQISTQLGIAPKTVENHMNKALKILRVALREFLTLFF